MIEPRETFVPEVTSVQRQVDRVISSPQEPPSKTVAERHGFIPGLDRSFQSYDIWAVD